MYKVYKYTFPNGMIYIGVTKGSIQSRRNNGYQHNKNLLEAIRAYGWKSVSTEILAELNTQKEAFSEEKKQIKLLNATDPGVGYNISHGGKNTFEGLHHTIKHREKMSRLMSNRYISPESLARMKEAHKKERHPVVSIDMDGNIIARYESQLAAANAVNGHSTNIKRACVDQSKIYKGYRWAFMKGGDEG